MLARRVVGKHRDRQIMAFESVASVTNTRLVDGCRALPVCSSREEVGGFHTPADRGGYS